eukprot:g69025.t1
MICLIRRRSQSVVRLFSTDNQARYFSISQILQFSELQFHFSFTWEAEEMKLPVPGPATCGICGEELSDSWLMYEHCRSAHSDVTGGARHPQHDNYKEPWCTPGVNLHGDKTFNGSTEHVRDLKF